ncbi:MAG: hypoxanthine phosphoribosyltransferase [Candidatus Eisenbacteria bacterium]|nr:hypoxanthine phosphoribosyltransferase [Candidatus Eisenbacteria bacterium]
MQTLLSRQQIVDRVAELGGQISRDYTGRVPILVGLLKGSVFFLADLIRHITCEHQVDFISISSYGGSTESSGNVRMLKDLEEDVSGRDLIVVEDIVDTGISLNYIRRNLLSRNPHTLAVCTLLDKEDRRVEDVPLDYVGFQIPNAFVVGYGLDLAERFRHLERVMVLEGSDLEETA